MSHPTPHPTSNTSPAAHEPSPLPIPKPPHAPESLRGAWLALSGLAAVFLFEMLDNSILNVALPTIGRELQASTTSLQWVTGAYSVVFGGLMLLFGAVADRYGRKRVMLIGLTLLGLASLATVFVTTAEELIVVRAVMGIAAAMTTPGSMALAFRLFGTESLRVRAITLISTAGLIGLAVGPTAGGLLLAVAPWQWLLLVNVPIAAVAFMGIRAGVRADDPSELHTDPVDATGALLATATIVLALVTPTLFVSDGADSWIPWAGVFAAALAGTLFVLRERTARFPLLDLQLIARPLVSSGLAYKAAAGLATAGLTYLITLQLQLELGWTPALAAAGMLPQVVVLLALGRFVDPFVKRVGINRAAWLSASTVVAGLAVYAMLHSFGYTWIALSLALVAAGLRVVGVVAAVNILSGLPANRTSIGAALTDTTTEVANAIGIAITGTLLAALFAGSIAETSWSVQQSAEFDAAITLGAFALALVASSLVAFGIARARRSARPSAEHPEPFTRHPEPQAMSTPTSA